MRNPAAQSVPADQAQRDLALDPHRSVLVQAPAGSGKTDLLTRRFLRLLSLVDQPDQIVAITFTIAAAAEMRHRILSELEKASAPGFEFSTEDESSMAALAHRALQHSIAKGWQLLDLPSQLRISTIDSFCRELALQRPLLSGLGGGIAIAAPAVDLYRRAARHVLNQIEGRDSSLVDAIEQLLRWRDNNWHEIENLLVGMLERRDRWMHDFVVSDHPDWDELRERLERPFANAVRKALTEISELLDQTPDAREEIMQLGRFACAQTNGMQHQALAELLAFPQAPFSTVEALEEAHGAMACLARLVLKVDGDFRRRFNVTLGFPPHAPVEKSRVEVLARQLAAVPGLGAALGSVCKLPPARYPEEDWQIIRACFTLLRHAAAQLKVVFAEEASVDFIEVAQIAQSILQSDDGLPSDAALALADGIQHLLVDEFQDTSRRQHRLLAGILGAWNELDPAQAHRTCFLVGDPMQSIYFFRDADAELFSRVREIGLEIPNSEPWQFDFATLSANFRTAKPLVRRLNEIFTQVFAENDGSGITFSPASPARDESALPFRTFDLHLKFCPRKERNNPFDTDDAAVNAELHGEPDAQVVQAREIVDLIRNRQAAMTQAAAAGNKYRIAVLARARKALASVAEALREAAIPFRAIDLEKLGARPEILDALSLARALLNPFDRTAWLGVLRAPWCGLTLEDLHLLTSADNAEIQSQPVPALLLDRLTLLISSGQRAVRHVLSALHPDAATGQDQTASTGTWLEQYWQRLGGPACYDASALANLELLWSCLDSLPGGREDVLGPALPAALNQLTALPDPSASADCGVQLMTIHASKGLEFEVVIVPDLQARTAGNEYNLLSWLERGLDPDQQTSPEPGGEMSEITEFLIAPLPSRGEASGQSKKWVDAETRKRESQEDRRILYVAATRAREELHLFARPAYKVSDSGELTLVEPPGGLLSTAWPALADEVRLHFDAWRSSLVHQTLTEETEAPATTIESLAASAQLDLFAPPSEADVPKPTILRRLPHDLLESEAPSAKPAWDHAEDGVPTTGPSTSPLYTRHEGGMTSRALGTAVHALFEQLAQLRANNDWETARTVLRQSEQRILAAVRSVGIDATRAAALTAEALRIVFAASHDPVCQWILAPHPDAASEVRWTGVINGAVRTVQADRVFKAGASPETTGQSTWWIIDYKTSSAERGDDSALQQQRALFAPQLEAYGQVLRKLHGATASLRAGLYYPRTKLFDWWEL